MSNPTVTEGAVEQASSETAATESAASPSLLDPEVFGQYVELYALKLLAALAILVLGLFLAKIISSTLRKVCEKRQVEATVAGFFASILYGILVVAVLIAAISHLGVPTASFVAVLGAAGLAVGLALQGSLSNFASGVLLILFKPFKVGNFVEAGGEMGVVAEVGLLFTELRTLDNIRMVMPNSQVMGAVIKNFAHYPTRRCDMDFAIGHGEDAQKAMDVIQGILGADERVLKEPEMWMGVTAMTENGVTITVRPWVESPNLWALKTETIRRVKEGFEAANITFALPRRTLYLHHVDEPKP